MIDAEYEELGRDEGELDLADTDSLPWLESDETDDDAGGIDAGQILVFLAGLVLLLGVVVTGVWYVSKRAAGGEVVADGSIIAAPEGPIKERPEEAGGKEFAGTGSVAPVVGEGGSRPAVVAEKPITPPLPELGTKPTPTPTPTAAAGTTAPAPAPVAQGVGVQLAAYGTRARAEEGWTQISRRTPLLSGVKYRVVEGKVDIGTVYRLQAVAPNRAEAEKLCSGLKGAGVDCQIK